MIKILIQTTHMQINYTDATTDEISKSEGILNSKFLADDITLKYTSLAKKGMISLTKSFYVKDKNLLPTGFLYFLKQYYDKVKLNYEVVDFRKFPKVNKQYIQKLLTFYKDKQLDNEILFGELKPRDYQIKSTLLAIKNRGGIIQLPTGTGKTLLIAMIAKIYNNSKILCIFDSVDLIYQTYDALIKQLGINENEISIIQGKNIKDNGRIILLSVDSYEKAYDLFPYINVIIVDEAHNLGSGDGKDLATRVLYSCQNATIKIGLTATGDVIENPYRQMALYGNIGPIVYKETIKDKINDNTLANIEVEMYYIDGPSPVITGNWGDVYEEQILKTKKDINYAIKNNLKIIEKNNKTYGRKFIDYGDESTHYVYNNIRNKKIAEIAKQNKRVLILFTRKAHGLELQKLLPEAKLIDGSDDKLTRNEAKKFLLENENNIVLASKIWNQGVDIPWIKTLIIAGAGKSMVVSIQRLGRSTRKDESTQKISAKFIDFYDRFSPLAIKQSNKRINTYENYLGFTIKYKD